MTNNNKPKHDQLFRKVEVAHELIEAHVRKDILALIDKTSLKLEKESFVEADLTTRNIK